MNLYPANFFQNFFGSFGKHIFAMFSTSTIWCRTSEKKCVYYICHYS